MDDNRAWIGRAKVPVNLQARGRTRKGSTDWITCTSGAAGAAVTLHSLSRVRYAYCDVAGLCCRYGNAEINLITWYNVEESRRGFHYNRPGRITTQRPGCLA